MNYTSTQPLDFSYCSNRLSAEENQDHVLVLIYQESSSSAKFIKPMIA